MATTTKGEITRARVINETIDLILKTGFINTSLNDITKHTVVKKGNLYFHFPSKEALGEAILDEMMNRSTRYLKDGLQGKTPMEKIANYLDSVFARHKKMNFVGGWLIGNTAIEMGDTNTNFSAKITGLFSYWKETLAQILDEAKNTGELKNDLDSRVLAKHIIAIIEGGIMMAKASKNGDDLQDCLDSLRAMLEIKS